MAEYPDNSRFTSGACLVTFPAMHRCPILSLFLALTVVVAAHAADNHPLVLAQRGDLPIILSAPHGGTNAVPGVARRQSGTLVTDAFTLELTQATARELERLLGAKPFVVACLAKREFLDVNRAPAEAFEDADARLIYRAYHTALSNAVATVRQRFPAGALLLDVHGQKAEPLKIVRGTVNGLTVQRMLTQHGHRALGGDDSVLGRLAAAGYGIVPPNTPPGTPPEMVQYVGGFIVRTYGSHQPHGIDALQLETGTGLRTNRAARAKLAVDLAVAIAAYHRTYLHPQPTRPGR